MSTEIFTFPQNLPAGAQLRLITPVKGLPKGAILRPVRAGKAENIGTVEDDTQRTVLHEPKQPETIQKLVTQEHEEVKKAIQEAISEISGAKLSGERETKPADRVEEKIEEGQSAQTVRDYSGFRIAVEDQQAWKQTAAALRKYFYIPEEQDLFEAGSELNFHGHTLQVQRPESKVSHEVQVLPLEVAENADLDHPLYEKAREGDKAAERELKDRNREHWEAFLVRTGTQKYKFGSIQASVPEGGEADAAIEAARMRIADADLAGAGKDVGGNHVTVRYGINREKPGKRGKLREFLRSQNPVWVVLGKTEAFPPSQHSDNAAVIIAPLFSPELHRLHEEIAGYADFNKPSFAEYRPHVTVAYVKPAAADKYTGLEETEGRMFRIDAVEISSLDGSVESVQLAGEKGGRGESPEQPGPLESSAGPGTISEQRNERSTSESTNDNPSEAGGKLAISAVPDGAAPVANPLPAGDSSRSDPGGRSAKVDHEQSMAHRRGIPESVSAGPVASDSGPGKVGYGDLPQLNFGSDRASSPELRHTLFARPLWAKGDRFVSFNSAGSIDTGKVDYWNPGINGIRPFGRVRLNGGTRRSDTIPDGAMRLCADPGLLKPVTGTEGEEQVLDWVMPAFADFVADYLVRNTRYFQSIVATDAAKKLIPCFQVEPTLTDRDVCAAACAIHDAALDTLLGVPPMPGYTEVLLPCGSPGSGKTFGSVLGGQRPGVGIVFEYIPTDAAKLCCLLDKLIASGRRPVLEWVWVEDPAQTVHRMIYRALGKGKRPGIGRTVEIEYMAQAWKKVPEALKAIEKQYRSRVEIVAVDNSGPVGDARILDSISGPVKAAASMTLEAVRERMRDAMEKLAEEGCFDTDTGKKVKMAAEIYVPSMSGPALLPVPSMPPMQAFKEKSLSRKVQNVQNSMEKLLKEKARAAWASAAQAWKENPELTVPF